MIPGTLDLSAYHTGGEGGKVCGMNMDKRLSGILRKRTSFETRVAFTKNNISCRYLMMTSVVSRPGTKLRMVIRYSKQ